MIVKVCGMREAENIRAVEQAGADWMGFIFYPLSPRFVNVKPDYLPAYAKRVGVFVDEHTESILRYVEEYRLDMVQLHGNEQPEQCAWLRAQGVGVVKAFPIKDEESLQQVMLYKGTCDYYLFDTACSGYGGSGKRFDWTVLNAYAEDTPFLLSGGLSPDSADAISRFTHPQLAGVDLNSGFECSPGIKDESSIKRFIQILKQQ